MHTKLPIISFLQNSSFFVAWFSKNSRISFWIRNFMASCLSRHDQMVYSIFQNHAPRGVKFFQMIPKWRKVFIKMDWLLTMITNPFEIPVIQNLETFSFFIFLFKTKYHPISRQKQNEKLFFCIFFFQGFKTLFFWQVRKNFCES